MTHCRITLFLLAAIVGASTGCGSGSRFASLGQGYTKQYPSPSPVGTIEGIDVYAGDGPIDWMKVKASGRHFAFIKATQGDYNTQSTFVANWANARAAGITRSAYHFYDPTKDGVAQANWFLAELQAAGGMDDADLPPTLDAECPVDKSQASAVSQDSHCEYPGNSGWAPPAQIAQGMFDWLDTVQSATGRKSIIYSYPSWFASVDVTDARLADYPLYIATVASYALVPAPWTSAVFWQYSSSTTVPGVKSPGDVDRFFGTAADLAAFVASTLPAKDGGVDAAAEDLSGLDEDQGVGIVPERRDHGCQYAPIPGQRSAPICCVFLVVVLLGLRRRFA